MSIYVGNLSNEVTEARLNSLLAEYTSVKQIQLSQERDLAVVEMGTVGQEEAAIEKIDNTQWYDRFFTVNQNQSPLQIQMAFKGKHTCPCCSSTLLRHIRLGSIHWRCSQCYQEMPIL